MTDLAAYNKHLSMCNAETILSDKTFFMLYDTGESDPAFMTQRVQMLEYECTERHQIPVERVAEWVRATIERYDRDPEGFMRAALEETSGPAFHFETVTAQTLQDMDIPPTVYIVRGLLTAGLSMLASKPKMGKSWMVLDLCLSVSAGLPFLGYPTNQGECLYLALEDSPGRLQRRMNKLLDGKRAPAGFEFATSAYDIENGLMDQMEDHLARRPETKLIVIDTLQKVRPPSTGRMGAYEADYKAMTPLKVFADKHLLCILLVHHLRKMGDDDDPYNRISGTNGIMGALDTAIVLDRKERSAEDTGFFVTGRDVETQDKIVRFNKDTCRWEMRGNADWLAEQRARLEYENNPIVKTIKKLLEQNGGTWSGGMQDLMNSGRYIARVNLATSTRKLTNEVKKLEPLLMDYDGITHTRAKHGNAGGKHCFSLDVNQPFIPFTTVQEQVGIGTVSTVGTVETVLEETNEPTPFDTETED